MNFNKEQQQAVSHKDGALLVLAGPGSGKTAFVTGRTCRLIEEGISPSSILVVTFTRAAAAEMKERFLRTNVFVSSSAIENSPNSIGEAMLLGTPIVASDVGGVSSLIEHGKTGFLYQADAPYMLAYYIEKLFDNSKLANQMSDYEIQDAHIKYQPQEILKQAMSVYNDMNK